MKAKPSLRITPMLFLLSLLSVAIIVQSCREEEPVSVDVDRINQEITDLMTSAGFVAELDKNGNIVFQNSGATGITTSELKTKLNRIYIKYGGTICEEDNSNVHQSAKSAPGGGSTEEPVMVDDAAIDIKCTSERVDLPNDCRVYVYYCEYSNGKPQSVANSWWCGDKWLGMTVLR